MIENKEPKIERGIDAGPEDSTEILNEKANLLETYRPKDSAEPAWEALRSLLE